jgi:hypothetical protein
MEWCKGDLIDVFRDMGAGVLAFTSNAVVRASEEGPKLVMGAGAAKRVRDEFERVDYKLGAAIARNTPLSDIEALGRTAMPSVYGLHPDYHVALASQEGVKILAVQVKRHYNAEGDLALARRSLEKFAEMMKDRPDRRAVINCPLIGFGGYRGTPELVEAMVEEVLAGVQVAVCKL